MPEQKKGRLLEGKAAKELPPGKRREGLLSLVATPIGNLEDITLRALRCLREADMIAAEDTRHTRKLLTHYDIHRPLVSYYQHQEKRKTGELLQALQDGRHIALVTDAGVPGISDPGAHLVQEVRRHGIRFEVLPGPSAVLTALLGSGLSMESFTFLGFPDAKTGPRRTFLEKLKNHRQTMVFFLAPHRLAAVLQDMLEVWGERKAVLCREMTKIHEEFIGDGFFKLLERTKVMSRGEYTLVVEGSREEEPKCEENPEAELRRLQAEGLSVNQAVARVARSKKMARAEVYALAHALNKKSH
ncbi:16S rRNA (cytidine(1402)-2'-O)-methyltransferase [candidate division FCPU426 bacterium]|nr:16S rRNA (cytidine(1402)-2'-O)-methyltransferase [candidate division FCPU426 bacterium]